MRKLASIRKVKDIKPIKNADRIVLAQVDGWWCITKKDEFQKGDLGVYFEIDSLLPDEDIYSFLGKASLRDGEYRHRIKTMKMRGVISQGLLLPLSLFEDRLKGYKEGDDVTEILNVKKYDDTQKFKSKNTSSKTKGVFPSFLVKTDQERCVSENSIISTSKGNIEIKKIIELYKQNKSVNVLSYNGTNLEYKPIIDASIQYNNNDWWEVKAGKEKLICTSNHKIWCVNKNSYIEVRKMKVGDKVLIC